MRFKDIVGYKEQSKVTVTTTENEKKRTKFASIIDRYKILEQTTDDANNAALQDAALDPSTQQTQQAQQEPVNQPEEQDVKELTPEGEVELIRLIRTALMIDVDPNKIPSDILNTDINQNNGREIYEKLKAFISTYTG